MKRQPRAEDLGQLQAQLDWSRAYYNNVRPHRALNRRTPAQAYGARVKACPKPAAQRHYRLRTDIVDDYGKVSLRYGSKMHHIGIGRAFAGTRVELLIAERDVRVIDDQGELLGRCTIDPGRRLLSTWVSPTGPAACWGRNWA